MLRFYNKRNKKTSSEVRQQPKKHLRSQRSQGSSTNITKEVICLIANAYKKEIKFYLSYRIMKIYSRQAKKYKKAIDLNTSILANLSIFEIYLHKTNESLKK